MKPTGTALERQIACVEREVNMRLWVYFKRVNDGRMSQKKADEELETMREVLDTLRSLPDKEKLV